MKFPVQSLAVRSFLSVAICAACEAYPTFTLPFERIAEAPVVVTCLVETTIRDKTPLNSGRAVAAHATLLVLRTLGPDISSGSQMRLDYEALPEGDSGISGPDVPPLAPGAVFALGLKSNQQPLSEPWRLIQDEGESLVIPAQRGAPPFAGKASNGREFLLNEIAAVLIAGSHAEVLSEVKYAAGQRTIATELTRRLDSKLGPDRDRWALIAASILSSMGLPRPTVADLRRGKNEAGIDLSSSLITMVLRRLGASQKDNDRLIHQLLLNSDIASWGVGMTLREFAVEPELIRELRGVLNAHRPGSLYVAFLIGRPRELLDTATYPFTAGSLSGAVIGLPRELLDTATSVALQYLTRPGTKESDLRISCWIIRDFGTDEQFAQLMEAIQESQYQNRHRYDLLWSAMLWSDNRREYKVLAILLNDHRIFQSNQRYSDVALVEQDRLRRTLK
jgi:hypothetical protein